MTSDFVTRGLTYVVLVSDGPHKGGGTEGVVRSGLGAGGDVPNAQLVGRLLVFGKNEMGRAPGEAPTDQQPRLRVQVLQEARQQDGVGQ